MEPKNPLIEDFIRNLPKAELHVHLEGSVSPERFLEFSRRQKTEFASLSAVQVRDELFSYKDFLSFLDVFKTVCLHLREPEDYLVVLEDLAENLKNQNVRYAEVFYTPAIPWKSGRDGRLILKQLLEAGADIQRRSGLEIRWILDNVRQFGPEPAWETARLAAEFRNEGVLGIGLGGDENSLPAKAYEEVFSWARANALFAHVHAGETGEPAQIWDALKTLRANRIGHGIQAARDPLLMEYLRDRTIGLDICLTSNALTGAWSPISSNPFWLLRKRGVPVTLNTDDPGLFKTNLNTEYLKAAGCFDLEYSDLVHVALQGVRSSFLPHEARMLMMQQFQDEIRSLLESNPGCQHSSPRSSRVEP